MTIRRLVLGRIEKRARREVECPKGIRPVKPRREDEQTGRLAFPSVASGSSGKAELDRGLRILIVGQHFWPESFRITEVAEALVKSGCSVSVLTGQPNYPVGKTFPGYSAFSTRSESKAGINVHRVPQIPRGSGSAIRLVLNYLSFVLFASLFGPWLLRRQRFDVVFVYAPGPILQAIPGLLIGGIKGAAVCTWVQDLWPESLETTGFVRNRTVLNAMAVLVRWIYRRHDLLLVPSKAFVESVGAMAGCTPVVYHPNPGQMPLDKSPAKGEAVLGLNPGFNVIFAGNLGAAQSLETILDAAERTKHVDDLWWVIIGSGRRSSWLASEAERRDLKQVMLPGWIAPENMPQVLGQASILLVTLARSPIMSLTIPTKIQAYLAAGRPIVAALDGEGARVVMEAGAGLACPSEDPAALADAVLRLKALPADALAQMGEAGRNYYQQHFDPDALTERLMSLLGDTIAKRSHGHGRASMRV